MTKLKKTGYYWLFELKSIFTKININKFIPFFVKKIAYFVQIFLFKVEYDM